MFSGSIEKGQWHEMGKTTKGEKDWNNAKQKVPK